MGISRTEFGSMKEVEMQLKNCFIFLTNNYIFVCVQTLWNRCTTIIEKSESESPKTSPFFKS